jgi:hypothetical protein
MSRPEPLEGAIYRIGSPLSPHALYVTIIDLVLDPGTEHEMRRPCEIFINSRTMEHSEWIVALTRILSATFRKGGDLSFLVDEMRNVFDPEGGCLKREGQHMPSLAAGVGDVIEMHLRRIGPRPGAPSAAATRPE